MPESSTRARYGADAVASFTGKLPNPFPRTMGPNCMKYLQEVVESGLSTDMIGRFERAFSGSMGVKHCIATPGCTPALAALAAAFSFEPGDEIIVSPITDYGTVQGLIRENYIPVFADTAPGTINLNAETIEPLISQRTRAILVVHMTGLVCDMDPINALAKRHDLIVYEDVCQAVFSDYKGRLAGSLAHAAGYSFDSEKTMGSDIGGCVVTDNDALAERIRFIGQSRGGEMRPGFGRIHSEPGYAYRMTMSTAAISLAQLEILPSQIIRRDLMIRHLSALLSEIPGIHPLPIPDYQLMYSCWMAGFSIDPVLFRIDADSFAEELAAAGIPGIGTGKYYLMPEALTFLQERASNQTYPYALPPASRRYQYSAESCPTARDFLKTFIRWSTFCEKYEPEDCEHVSALVQAVAERNRI